MENTKKFGKVWGYQEGPTNVLVISELKVVKELLHSRFDEFQQRKLPPIFQTEADDRDSHMVDAWGARWKRLRALVSPQFSNKSLKKIYPTVDDSAKHLLKHIGKNANGAPIDIYPYFQEYSIDVICRVAIGIKDSTQWKSEYAKKMIHVTTRDPRDPFFFLAAMSPFLRKYIRYLFTVMAKRFKFAGGKLLNRIGKAVAERKAERAKGGVASLEEKDSIDFIDLFLDAEADVDLKAEEGLSGKNAQIVRHMLEEEVVMQCFLFLLAGFDTTSNTLSYTAWYLAKHPQCQRRLQEEIDQVCGEQAEIGYDDLSELKYMDCVVKETLRLNPHATVVVGRVAGQDLEIAGIRLKKGDKVQVDSYSIQRDKEIWGADAEEFKPDRWLDLTPNQKDAYLAFGAGPRQCVGMRLAYIEQKIALARILREYELICGPKTEKKLDHSGWFTVSPASVTVNVRKRDQ
ncbi:unnamed protein product, partial [Mesorhabditis belari]|uniref:Cytochrome P450 n=1 Tax=Mesorhabditis belari TaxID=2138241 RepID=A0AAF3EF08_9BILA